MLQYNLSCRNCANLVMAIKICMHKSNPLVFFLFSSLSLSDCSYIYYHFSECMGYISLEPHSTFPCLTCLESEEVKGYSRRTKDIYLCCPLPHEKTFPDRRRQETASHEVLYGYADFDHADSISFPDRTVHLRIECSADTFQNSIRWLKKFNSTEEELLLGSQHSHRVQGPW